MQNKNQKTKTKSKQLSMNALGENNLNACRRLNGFALFWDWTNIR